MRKTTLLIALTMTSAIAATPSFAKNPSLNADAYQSSGGAAYAHNDRYSGRTDIQVNPPRTPAGPELVNAFPFRSES